MSSTVSSTSTSNFSGTKQQLVPRADSKQAKKAEARKTNTLDKLSLRDFLKESEAPNEGKKSGKESDADKDGGSE